MPYLYLTQAEQDAIVAEKAKEFEKDHFICAKSKALYAQMLPSMPACPERDQVEIWLAQETRRLMYLDVVLAACS